jgi:hypothetical protein
MRRETGRQGADPLGSLAEQLVAVGQHQLQPREGQLFPTSAGASHLRDDGEPTTENSFQHLRQHIPVHARSERPHTGEEVVPYQVARRS